MDPFSIACGVAGFVGLIPPLIDVCTKGYGMLSSAKNVGKEWRELEWRRKVEEERFTDWKIKMQLQADGFFATLEPESTKYLLVVETLAEIVECFCKIKECRREIPSSHSTFDSALLYTEPGGSSSRRDGRQEQKNSRFQTSFGFRSKSNTTSLVSPDPSSVSRSVLSINLPSSNKAANSPPQLSSAEMLTTLLQHGQKDVAEIKKAVVQLEEIASSFKKTISTRDRARWAIFGKDRLKHAVDSLEKYNNGLFEITKEVIPMIPIGSSVLNSSTSGFHEFKVGVNLPLQRNLKFCGRKDILDKLCQLLTPDDLAKARANTPGSNSGRKSAVLYGMGGIGKSQVALQYAHEFGHLYTSIFWIDADNVSSTTDSAYKIVEQLVAHYAKKWRTSPDYEEIANILGIPGHIDISTGKLNQGSTDVAMEAVRNWLSADKNRGWLLLVDNNDKPKVGVLKKLIPTCNWGSVIVTTRVTNLHMFGECVEVEGIGAEAGLELLLKSSGNYHRKLDESERGKAQNIVKDLGELPLALDQAGANSVLTTWELSFQELSDDARQLLHMCSFLSNEDIPDDLFHRGRSAVAWMMEDAHRLDNAMGNLFRLSLAKRKVSDDGIRIHPLVHSWAREHITDPTIRRQNAEDTLALVASAIVTDEYKRSSEDWMFERRIFNHLKICEERILEHFNGSESVKVADASFSIASVYRELGFYQQAKALCQRAIDGYEKSLGRDHPSFLNAIDCMGYILYKNDQCGEALEWKLQELAGREKIFGSEHPSTFEAMNNLANVFAGLEKYKDALELYLKALAGKEKSLGKDHRSTLQTVHGIACAFQSQGRSDKALKWYQRAAAGLEKALGDEHPETLAAFHNIGLSFEAQGRYHEALKFYQRALAGQEKMLGKDHRRLGIPLIACIRYGDY
ncbi:hypothetical protein RUND412_008348 [Rhizina undulata]